MSNPRGNPGNKGGGRKAAWAERADGEIAKKIFFQDYDIEEIDKIAAKIRDRKGKLSIREVMIIKALGGNEKILTAIWGKVAADKVEHTGAVPVKDILNKEINEPPHESATGDKTGTTNGGTPDHREQERPVDSVSSQQDTKNLPPPANA